MRESARTALSLVRSRAADLGLTPEAFRRRDIHVHVPAGAIPKDGPSAGVTMATSLASLFTGRAVRPDLAMTGEITLRGRVMPVGGIKEKVLAAHRAGVRTVVLPARNRKDLEDIPAPVRSQIEFQFADSIEQIWKAALRLAPRRRNSAARAPKASRPAVPKRPAARRSARRRGDPAAAISYSSRRSPS
jgi:ATP-dependent Lon protease